MDRIDFRFLLKNWLFTRTTLKFKQIEIITETQGFSKNLQHSWLIWSPLTMILIWILTEETMKAMQKNVGEQNFGDHIKRRHKIYHVNL